MIRRPISPAPPPAALLAGVAGRACPFLLDSAGPAGHDGRRSFLGCDPIDRIDGRTLGQDPLGQLCTRLESSLRQVGCSTLDDRPAPRAVGFLAYELGERIEPRVLATGRPGGASTPLCFNVYDAVYCYDHALGTGWIEADSDGAARALEGKLRTTAARRPVSGAPRSGGWSLDRAQFGDRVERALEYIRRGDVYQVNLSRRLELEGPVDPLSLYERLRRANPASFGAYLDLGDAVILSSSPERFVRWERSTRRIETRPIKGTRPRGQTAAEDAALARELLEDAKERAEHVMIVDLERNDLGRIAEVGSVRADPAPHVQSLARVHHLVSSVQALTRPGTSLEQVLRATFPGGSITGAPKVRAMQLIAELEPVQRGVYTGAIGHLDRAGGCDLAIAIRTIVVERDRLSLHVGAGIVADSDPAREFAETEAKAAAMLEALGS